VVGVVDAPSCVSHDDLRACKQDVSAYLLLLLYQEQETAYIKTGCRILLGKLGKEIECGISLQMLRGEHKVLTVYQTARMYYSDLLNNVLQKASRYAGNAWKYTEARYRPLPSRQMRLSCREEQRWSQE